MASDFCNVVDAIIDHLPDIGLDTIVDWHSKASSLQRHKTQWRGRVLPSHDAVTVVSNYRYVAIFLQTMLMFKEHAVSPMLTVTLFKVFLFKYIRMTLTSRVT